MQVPEAKLQTVVAVARPGALGVNVVAAAAVTSVPVTWPVWSPVTAEHAPVVPGVGNVMEEWFAAIQALVHALASPAHALSAERIR